jgi:hypothetical protein
MRPATETTSSSARRVTSPVPVPLTILSNPASTGNLLDPNWMTALIAAEPAVTRRHTTTPEAIGIAVQEAVDRDCKVLAVDGGDGTADLVMSALISASGAEKPALILLPSGKTNMTAAAWCGGHDRQRALSALLDLRRRGDLDRHVRSRTALAVRHGDAGPIRHGAFFGAADVVDGILFCRRRIYPLGLPNAVSHSAAVSLMFWRAIAGGAGQHLTADWKGGGEQGAFFFLGITTLDRLILGLNLEPSDGQGALTYLSLGAGPRALFAALPAFLLRRAGPGFRRTVRRVDTITLKFKGAYTLDGELYESDGSTPIEIASAGALPVITLDPP